jgi:hypothetical protein
MVGGKCVPSSALPGSVLLFVTLLPGVAISASAAADYYWGRWLSLVNSQFKNCKFTFVVFFSSFIFHLSFIIYHLSFHYHPLFIIYNL